MDTRQYQECGGCGRLYTEEEIAKMDTHDCNEEDE
jgi:hypothetical protein